MPRLRRILTLGLTATLLTPAAPAPAFRDGFESPAVGGQGRRLPTGSHIGPWTVTAGNVDLATTGLWQTPAGRQTLDLDGDTNGTVSTTIAVRPLTTYKVTYALAGNPAAAPMLKTGQVRVNGRTVQRFTFDTSLTSLSKMAFTSRSLYVFALGKQLRLDFASTTTPAGYGPVLDDVRVDSCLVILCPSTRTSHGGARRR
jgi:choice-of-anchor C domain-containing protein